MYQSIETQTEELQEAWCKEYAAHSLAVLVDAAMAECVLSQNGGIGDPAFNLRIKLGEVYQTLPVEMRIEWAHRLDKDILSFEQFVERESGEC